MSLQAPRRRRGSWAIDKLKNQEAAIRAYFKARGGRHGATGNPAVAHKDREKCQAMAGRTRQTSSGPIVLD